MSGKPMSKEDSSRIQSTQAKAGNDTGSGTFASRSQSAGDKQADSAQKSTSGGGGGDTSGGASGGQAQGQAKK